MPPTTKTCIADGIAIRRRRERLGVSQGALAAAAGLNGQGHMSRIENGKAQPSPPLLAQIAAVLGVEVDAISTPVEDVA